MTLFGTICEFGIMVPEDPVSNKDLLPFGNYKVVNIELLVRIIDTWCGVGRLTSNTLHPKPWVFSAKMNM